MIRSCGGYDRLAGSTSFTFCDLFAGIGGIRMALEKAGGKCIFSSEWNAHARQTYYDNFKEWPKGDITQIEPYEIPDHDVLAAGFPCQPVSLAGGRKGINDERWLIEDVCRIADDAGAEWLILENVPGIYSANNGKAFDFK